MAILMSPVVDPASPTPPQTLTVLIGTAMNPPGPAVIDRPLLVTPDVTQLGSGSGGYAV